ncbi:BON domain-containing protein [Deminuibacter soli]|uniref:BON domain-containing protein n=1 Tax=Deminuibacter soli TaxID=2291815 RepID=A0A3E1NRM1_9BACT|nr:BON domain-containing protein [Deminuibacter soli]RFM30589.1 BON domain-containing protein [Deminuibacter soli]
MKKHTLTAFVAVLLFTSFTLFSCKSKPSDADIQAAIATAVSTIPGASAASAAVKDGVVTITGQFTDDAAKSQYETAVKNVKGVKSVQDNANVQPQVQAPVTAPVEISADDALNKGLSDAVKDFNGVQASVKDGVVTLTGEIKRSDLPKLMQSVSSLRPKKIDNKLVIK